MIITTEEKLKRAADEKVHREHELNAYENNITRYRAMFTFASPVSLPNHLVKYKGMPPEKIPFDVSLEDVLLIKDHEYKDELLIRIRCESIELNKVKMICDALDMELPNNEEEKNIAISEAVSRRAATMENNHS